MNKEELQTTIDNLQPLYQKELEVYFSKRDKIVTEVKDLFKDIVDVEHSVYVEYGYNLRVRIEITKDNKSIFGTTVSIYCTEQHHSNERKVVVGTGSTGSFGMDDIGQIKKYEVMANFCKDFEKYNEILLRYEDKLREARLAADKFNNLIERCKREIKQIEDNEQRQAKIQSIKVGNVYDVVCSYSYRKALAKGFLKLRIDKITENNIFVTFFENLEKYPNWKEGGRIDKDTFIGRVGYTYMEVKTNE